MFVPYLKNRSLRAQTSLLEEIAEQLTEVVMWKSGKKIIQK